jgi:hypothetical protein
MSDEDFIKLMQAAVKNGLDVAESPVWDEARFKKLMPYAHHHWCMAQTAWQAFVALIEKGL